MMDDQSILSSLDPCKSLLPFDAENGVPGFGDPWHAQAFGTSMALARAGLFTWETWVATFSAEIKAHPQLENETSEAAYYRQWLTALESLVGKLGAVSPDEIGETSEHWRRSYLNTPHGKPIVLARDWPSAPDRHDDDHGHHHHHRHSHSMPSPKPVAVDRARA